MQGTRRHRELIDGFWDRFGGVKTQGRGLETRDKLGALKRMASVVVPYKNQSSRNERRRKFDMVKATRHKMHTHARCFACGEPATCRHHIIQLQNGGINSKRNMVSLCDPCHGEVHPWLRR